MQSWRFATAPYVTLFRGALRGVGVCDEASHSRGLGTSVEALTCEPGLQLTWAMDYLDNQDHVHVEPGTDYD